MKAFMIGGAMAAALFAAPVFADDYSYPPSTTTTTTDQKTITTTPPSDLTPPPPVDQNKSTVVEEHSYTTTAPVVAPVPVKKDTAWYMKGGEFLLSGGVEGWGGAIAPQVRAGPSWGVRLGVKPTRMLGLELGYSGAANEINSRNS